MIHVMCTVIMCTRFMISIHSVRNIFVQQFLMQNYYDGFGIEQIYSFMREFIYSHYFRVTPFMFSENEFFLFVLNKIRIFILIKLMHIVDTNADINLFIMPVVTRIQ